MKELWIISLAIMLSWGTAVANNDTDDCYKVNELELEVVKSGLETMSNGTQVMSGVIVNHSKHLGYEDVKIKAELLDCNLDLIGEQVFTIDEDVELHETEDFSMPVRNAQDVFCVRYEVVCAEID